MRKILLILVSILNIGLLQASVNCEPELIRNDSTTEIVTISPSERHQTIEGWGGSLCWWANIMGSYSDEKIQTICNWITHPTNGLNMNIFRFNIGGGDHPLHQHMRADGGAMPGYKDSANAPYNWKSDAAQRKILQQLIISRKNNTGVNDVKIIGFSNSPPWWMTVSGCSAGSADGTSTNLRADMFEAFAEYLTDVTRYYHDSLHITFDHLEPFNEPFSNWWKAMGGQEGCHFTQTDQEKLIRIVYNKLSDKNMLSYCKISAMDGNSIDETYHGVLGYSAAGDIVNKIDRIDVHSYAGSKRKELATWCNNQKVDLWQSESGPLSVGGTEVHQMMVVCDRIITDFKELGCKAWIDWQLAADESPQWGLLVGSYKDAAHPVNPGIDYYLRAQYSRFLKTGYTIIGNNSSTVLTALNPQGNELVIVISNSANQNKKYEIDLRKFRGNAGVIKKIMTRADVIYGYRNFTEDMTVKNNRFRYEAPSLSVSTFVVPVKTKKLK